MGNAESKGTGALWMNSQEAKAMLSPEEVKRLEMAFDRGRRDTLNLSAFVDEVLSDRVPTDVVRALYDYFCCGSSGISFENLLVGLVMLSKASRTQRQEYLSKCENGDNLNLPLQWIEEPPLLTDDSKPKSSTFYQVLSGVTHLEEPEVAELEKVWPTLTDPRVCKMTPEGFKQLVSPPMPDKLCAGFFRAFDENNDGLIDFKELVCGLSASCRGPPTERLKFLARIWDSDGNGFLTRLDIQTIYEDLNVEQTSSLAGIQLQDDDNGDGRASFADFVCWANETKCANDLLDCVEQVGHVCLGLRPVTPFSELDIVSGYKQRLKVDDVVVWQVVSSEWWSKWSKACVQSTASGGGKGAGPIDNTNIIRKNDAPKLSSLTSEGGLLRTNLLEGRDFELVSPVLWSALIRWYGNGKGTVSLPRQVVDGREVELYPLTITILRHQTGANFPTNVTAIKDALFDWVKGSSPPVRRIESCTVTFSRETTVSNVFDTLCRKLRLDHETARLWLEKSEGEATEMLLLSRDEQTLHALSIHTGAKILLEVRSQDLTWPEEVSQLRASSSRTGVRWDLGMQSLERGTTGLNNLGNTCFMNSALQCISNTKPLTDYFLNNRHLSDLNRTNALGSKGVIATDYGSLVHELWSGKKGVIAPLKLRESVNRHAQLFKERGQHDCQEFLSFLLDGLHEDLNRVHKKPYASLKDSDGRPDAVVAKEAWDLHVSRDQSVIVELFTGMLRSCVTCKTCKHSSVRFDPFTFLTLPIPLEDNLLLQVVAMTRSGEVPFRYGFRLPSKTTIGAFKALVAEKCGWTADQFIVLKLKKIGLLWDLQNASIEDDEGLTIRTVPVDCLLYAFEKPLSSEEDFQAHVARRCHSSAVDDIQSHGHSNGDVVHTHSNPSYHQRYEHGAKWLQPRKYRPAWNAALAVNRKMEYREAYFLAHKRYRPVVFGIPMMVLAVDGQSTGRQLYDEVWTQVRRLVNAPAGGSAGTSSAPSACSNRALDADEGRFNEYPFTLKAVDYSFEHCAQCPWARFCSGCPLSPTEDVVQFGGEFNLAIDWEPTALYLRYQHSAELLCLDDSSVNETWSAHHRPVSLQSCLRDFTSIEQLDGGEMVHCKHCKANTPACKKLDIWKLPRILIVHLKRFVYVEKDRKWIKSLKVVDFPLNNFDPSEFVLSSSSSSTTTPTTPSPPSSPPPPIANGDVNGRVNGHHCHHPRDEAVRYNCFAIANHYGAMGAGHYVAYAKNANSLSWYLYNDSRCKPLVDESSIDKSGAYILFFERARNLSRSSTEETTRL